MRGKHQHLEGFKLQED